MTPPPLHLLKNEQKRNNVLSIKFLLYVFYLQIIEENILTNRSSACGTCYVEGSKKKGGESM